MVNLSKENSLPRRMLMLMLSLMVVSTILFAIGITLERTGEAGEAPGIHTEVQGEHQHQEGAVTEAAHNESAESSGEHTERSTVTEASPVAETTTVAEAHTETILGIDIENPVFVIAAIGVWLALTVGLWLFGWRILIPVSIVALGTALFDAVEVITQINRASIGIALLAALITILHLTVAGLAWQILRSSGDGQRNRSSSPV
ncbi:MAG: hypothetical protein ABI690_19740 [Chloroflexota bacterium]